MGLGDDDIYLKEEELRRENQFLKSLLKKPSSRAMLVRDEIARLDLPHRKGFTLSEGDGLPPTLQHLNEELDELREALGKGDYEHAKEEIGDVFACLLQSAHRLGMTFADLDGQAERKLRLRFLGAKDISIHNEGN